MKCIGTLTKCSYKAGGPSRQGLAKACTQCLMQDQNVACRRTCARPSRNLARMRGDGKCHIDAHEIHKCLYIYIISEETSIFAPQRLRFYRALGIAACTVGKVRASTVFMCVCSMFRPSDFLLFVKNAFVVGVRCQGNREPPADGATTPLSQRHTWLALPKQ